MKELDKARLSRHTKARSRQVSSTPWDIPEDHLEKEASLEERRSSGFNDPIGLRVTSTGGYSGVLAEGSE